MTDDAFSRTRILLGDEGVDCLARKHVLVAGLGGVGGHVAEALCRAGVGELTLVDHDVVSVSNLNRQLLALHSTLGQDKTTVMAERLRDINPDVKLNVINRFIHRDDAEGFVTQQGFADGEYSGLQFDFVVDCIDSIICKASLVAACQQHNVPVVSSMGAGNRVDVTKIKVASLNQTQNCPLAREFRFALRKMGVPLNCRVVYSTEKPKKALPHEPIEGAQAGIARAVNGTVSYLTGVFGYMLTGMVVQALLVQVVDEK